MPSAPLDGVTAVLIAHAKLASALGHHFREKVFHGGSNANRNKGGREPPIHTHAFAHKTWEKTA